MSKQPKISKECLAYLKMVTNALDENRDGIGHDAWTRSSLTEANRRADGMLTVIFRLFARFKLNDVEAQFVLGNLEIQLERVKDPDLYMIFWRGMHMVLGKSGLKLPKQRYAVMEDRIWTMPL